MRGIQASLLVYILYFNCIAKQLIRLYTSWVGKTVTQSLYRSISVSFESGSRSSDRRGDLKLNPNDNKTPRVPNIHLHGVIIET